MISSCFSYLLGDAYTKPSGISALQVIITPLYSKYAAAGTLMNP